jgi:hypothetical protein
LKSKLFSGERPFPKMKAPNEPMLLVHWNGKGGKKRAIRYSPSSPSEAPREEGALKVLARVGALPPPNAKGEYAKTVRTRGVKPSRLYEINPEKLEDAQCFCNVCNVGVLFDVTPPSVGNA